MGLTIHYTLNIGENWPPEAVHQWLENVADYASHLDCENVGPVVSAWQQPEVTSKLHKVGRKHSSRYVPIHANEGSMVIIGVGKGCEPLVLGLCKYPTQWRCQHGRSMRRWHPTGISREWQFSWFCKTQFSSQLGAAHFIRCHKTVISLLDFCKKSGLEVNVKDEAGYWEKRDEKDLSETLRRNEALLAAFGGLLKEVAEEVGDRTIESPIFDYANFEHLEHEGWERYGHLLAPLEHPR